MEQSRTVKRGHGFGTAPVFLAAISTILGAILFLRFGYAVAHSGVLGSMLIILIGHAISIPTALAIAEIATNLKVEGGGEYYIISRSFGLKVGGTIGISLYLSQAISVAFYMIAFAEAFTPLFPWIHSRTGIMPHTWMFSVPGALILLVVIARKGANLGVAALWVVVAILAVSLVMFFLGSSPSGHVPLDLFAKVEEPKSFSAVFAIIFPAFTGMTAGVGLSGDLKNPRKSIPLGTLSATLTGMVVYVLVVIKLGMSLSPQELAADQLAMSRIALWGPMIPIGLAAATLSSAIGSLLIAPRTMQALARDRVWPIAAANDFLRKGQGETNEPVHATLVTAVIVMSFVAMGSVDFVAQVISMFFMITYGTLCLVSFLEHFAGNPSYRPTFRSKWYLSLVGALACFIMMFNMSPVYAALALVAMVVIYTSINRGQVDEDDLSAMLKGALFQLTRQLQVLSQRKHSHETIANWRPSFVAVSSSSHTRLAPFDLLRWICHYHGFGTFIHFVNGPLNETNKSEAKSKLNQLIRLGSESHAGIYVDTIISPSFKTAVAQIVQMPGVSGMENNSVLFEFHEDDHGDIPDIVDGCQFAAVVDFNLCVLRSSERHFGYNRSIHIWLTPGDYRNANLMILLGYIIMGHPEWKGCSIDLYAALEDTVADVELKRLNDLIDQGRIPFSHKNVQHIPWNRGKTSYDAIVKERSEGADLVIMGFSLKKLAREKGDFFKRFKTIKDILFVRAAQKIALAEEEEEEEAEVVGEEEKKETEGQGLQEAAGQEGRDSGKDAEETEPKQGRGGKEQGSTKPVREKT